MSKIVGNKVILAIVVLLVIGGIIVLENQKVSHEPATTTKLVKEGLYAKAPELAGISGWINSEPFTIESLKGKVVIVDFWTYSCINCIRTLPYLKALDDKYREQGLVIIGVHTPEFAFEKKYENVVAAANMYGLEYPIVLDNDYATWNSYQNRYWPRKYLIDKDGYIRYDHIGEGGYEETEKQVQELLAETGVSKMDDLINITDKTPKTKNTPELYAGYNFAIPRGHNIGNVGGLILQKETDYKLPSEPMQSHVIYLEGLWISQLDNLEKVGTSDSSIYLKFSGKQAHIVANSQKEAKLYVYLNGYYISKDVAGKDVEFSDGKSFIRVNSPKLYTIYDGEYQQEQSLKLTTSDEEFSFNAFTFG